MKPDNELLQALIGMRASYLVNVAEAGAQYMCRCADTLLPYYHMHKVYIRWQVSSVQVPVITIHYHIHVCVHVEVQSVYMTLCVCEP